MYFNLTSSLVIFLPEVLAFVQPAQAQNYFQNKKFAGKLLVFRFFRSFSMGSHPFHLGLVVGWPR